MIFLQRERRAVESLNHSLVNIYQLLGYVYFQSFKYAVSGSSQWRSQDFSYGGAHAREARHLGGCGGMLSGGFRGGGARGPGPPPFSQRTCSRGVRAWFLAILCALARARVSAFYNGGSCTRAMKKRDIRTLTSVTKQGQRNWSGWSGQSRTTLQRSSNQYS